MKRGQIFEGTIVDSDFPNKSKVLFYEEKEDVKTSFFSVVKGGIEGQKIRFRIKRSRQDSCTGVLLETLEKSPMETVENTCPKFGLCGGCTYQSVPYEKQLELKKKWIRKIFKDVITPEKNGGKGFDDIYEDIHKSPKVYEYRNKMEFSFGDEVKDGPMTLGLHKKHSFYDVIDAAGCNIVNENYSVIINLVKAYVIAKNIPMYNKKIHEGTVRHLLVRYSETYDEILVAIVTSSQGNYDFTPLADLIVKAENGVDYEGENYKLNCKVRGVLNIVNDTLSDAVKCDKLINLYGDDYLMEKLLGKEFKLSVFSFFQTNTLGAEVLYSQVQNYVLEAEEIDGEKEDKEDKIDKSDKGDKVIFDLFCGTGTIAQILAPVARKVIGVELIEDAVEAAKVNANLNGLDNCEFIAGDVFKVLDEIEEKPDIIVLDPPREGVMPKALEKVLAYGVKNIVYVSCKPTSLARDLDVFFENGYEVKRMCNVDLFPMTVHVETVVCLSNKKSKDYVEIGVDAEDYYRIKDSEKSE
ncbi:MAG: 23S rRNA (uracil(1939)-C(5))-methyltransferase RlmD [Lachnospiraceae bacterium]|nr:23S rRNA (uracil(1939)-C(5))-methyltransferase RlmD [Lachnospiraceae bacterium]